MKQHSVVQTQQISLSFLYSSKPSNEALTLTQSAGFGMIMAIYPSLSACNVHENGDRNKYEYKQLMQAKNVSSNIKNQHRYPIMKKNKTVGKNT